MAQTVNILPHAEDRKRLLAIVADRNRPLKHVQRAKIILHSAERLSVLEVARRAGVSRPAVWRWQQRYGEQGVDGLLHEKTRKPGRTPLSPRTVAKVLEWTCSAPPGEATHWTGRTIAKAQNEAAPKKGKARRFMEFYDGEKSWSRVERIIARVEAGAEGPDTGFVVTNLKKPNPRKV